MTAENAGVVSRTATLTYGVICYVIFFLTFLYAIGFVGNLLVPKTIDGEPTMGMMQALAIDLVLLGIFAIQHSVMARPGFKKVWTRIVPEPVERSTYVLLSSLALILLFSYWQPLGATIWSVTNTVGVYLFYAGFAFGWGLVLVATFLILLTATSGALRWRIHTRMYLLLFPIYLATVASALIGYKP